MTEVEDRSVHELLYFTLSKLANNPEGKCSGASKEVAAALPVSGRGKQLMTTEEERDGGGGSRLRVRQVGTTAAAPARAAGPSVELQLLRGIRGEEAGKVATASGEPVRGGRESRPGGRRRQGQGRPGAEVTPPAAEPAR
ncbi:unnamed protein product [Pleuronectes platessa]|uniref:Uncharacterized protein n=1 Tax=Pleuronectes platessa TaxID=8262 RepID=A0A9N7VDD1_PLEPL|nr:unnamed protein product [Pleuronectes platessa]